MRSSKAASARLALGTSLLLGSALVDSKGPCAGCWQAGAVCKAIAWGGRGGSQGTPVPGQSVLEEGGARAPCTGVSRVEESSSGLAAVAELWVKMLFALEGYISPQQFASLLIFQRSSSLTPKQWGYVVLERPLATP